MPGSLTGDWGRLRAWAAGIKAGVFRDVYIEDMRKLGDAVERRAKRHIRNQDLPWPGLTSETIRKKGFSEVYVETREFMDSLQVEVTRSGRFSSKMTVGPTGEHSSGVSMQALAAFLEYGTSTSPSRPLWRPVMQELQELPEFDRLKDLRTKFSFR